MNKIIAIARKELRDYFLSPIAYIIIAIFLLVSGWFFFSAFFVLDQASMRDFFTLLPVTFSFIIPALTMRSFSEEFNLGSYEILITLPVETRQIVVGKFLGTVVFLVLMLLPTLFYPFSINLVGDLDWGPVIGGYIGAILLGACFASIGIFASSLSKNQITAFIIGTLMCLVLAILDKMLFFLPERLVSFANYIAADYHFQNFAKGVVDTRDVIYFLSSIFLFLYVTDISLQSKR